MDNMNGAHIIQALRRKWISLSVFYALLIAGAATVLFYFISHKFPGVSIIWSLLIFVIIFLFVLFARKDIKTTETGIAALLNQSYPALEESSALLLRDFNQLNTLERLQYGKTNEALSSIAAPLNISKKLLFPFGVLFTACIIGIIIYKLPLSFQQKEQTIKNSSEIKTAIPEKILPQVKKAAIKIIPPAYTKRTTREQNRFNIVIEEGSAVEWQIKTSARVTHLKFIFNDSATVIAKADDSSHQSWTTRLSPASGFYQLNIDGNLSELYKIETIPDNAPVIHIQTPKQYTTIDFGEPQQVLSRLDLNDDYGITNTSITATIASGSGEAVKFKEHVLDFPGFTAGKTGYQLQRLLSLPQLGMQPGDELYFYVKAIDNKKQETRSDIYIIHLPDTAQLMSLDGLANGINLKPEYFRSERQIIIETEQLLKDKDTISSEVFKNRSNNLGIDQKLLRLRYGKFLGEEDESGLFEGEVANDLGDASNFSNADKIKDAFTDKHDNAEDATFLEPEIKAQLKATLTEMWNAELKLRTFKPQEALPYEYKALRLLKELQQKSRAYVAKTNFKTTPLDLQKRLSGDLNKIISPVQQKDIKSEDDPMQAVRVAISTLEQLKAGDNQATITQGNLQKAALLLNEKARQQPSVYLIAVQALRKVIDNVNAQASVNTTDIVAAENGLQKMLSAPGLLPGIKQMEGNQQLSKQYFLNLQKKQP